MKVTMIGTGVYSFALASAISFNVDKIVMWTESDDLYQKYLSDGCVKDIIEGKSLKSNVVLTRSYEEALKDTDVVFLVTAAKYFRNVIQDMKNYLSNNVPICIATKGLDMENLMFLSEVLENVYPNNKVLVLSGPSFAADLADNTLIGLTLASEDLKDAELVKNILVSDKLKIEVIEDIIGLQIGGSIKNAYAIGAGIIDSLYSSPSTSALYLTEVIKEIRFLLGEFGSAIETVYSLGVIGDLVLTCGSTSSRNFSFGTFIGRDDFNKQEYLGKNTIEGYETLKIYQEILKKKGICLPLLDILYKIVVLDKDSTLLGDYLIKASS